MKKPVIFFAALFIALLIPGCILNTQQGLYVGDQFFRKESDTRYAAGADDFVEITPTEAGARFTVLRGGKDQDAEMTLEGKRARFAFADGEVIEGEFLGGTLVTEDGTPLEWVDAQRVVILSGQFEVRRVERIGAYSLYRMYRGEREARGVIALIAAYILLYVVGALSFLYPDRVHFFGSRWAYKNPELSESGVLLQKLGGIAAIVIGAILMFLPLFMR